MGEDTDHVCDLLTQLHGEFYGKGKAHADAFRVLPRVVAFIKAHPRAEEGGKLTDIPDLADKLTAHLAKIKLPADPHGWKVIVRIALIGALEKHLATKGDQTT